MLDLVSIIVPVYNVEKYLKECVDSLIQQTYSHIEIILVDDGSPDQSPLLCDELAKKDHRIIVIHQENGGLSDARNKGISVSNGRYITFVDSDDYVSLNFIEKMYKKMKEDKSQICISQIKQTLSSYYIAKKLFTREEALKYLGIIGGVPSIACAKLYDKRLFDAVSFPIRKLHEDEFIAHLLIDHCEYISYESEAIYYYVDRQGSITKGRKTKKKFCDGSEAFLNRTEFFIEQRLSVQAIASLHNAIGCCVQSLITKDVLESTDTKREKELIKKSVKLLLSILLHNRNEKSFFRLIWVFLYPKSLKI